MFAKDAVALVTGSATGIGLATAQAFSRAGCRVVLADRDSQRGELAATQIRALGQDALFVQTDVAVPADVVRLHEKALAAFGRLDAACNNAGIEGQLGLTIETSLENFDHIISTNLRGLFVCLQEQLKIMQRQANGAIVNIASAAGLVGFSGLSAYCASKGGVIQLTKTAAIEYATAGIRINAVCPGAIKTEMIDRITHEEPAVKAQFAALHPMNRMGTPAEVADAVVWLCSRQASFITGHALAVDGGMLAH